MNYSGEEASFSSYGVRRPSKSKGSLLRDLRNLEEDEIQEVKVDMDKNGIFRPPNRCWIKHFRNPVSRSWVVWYELGLEMLKRRRIRGSKASGRLGDGGQWPQGEAGEEVRVQQGESLQLRWSTRGSGWEDAALAFSTDCGQLFMNAHRRFLATD